MSNEICVPAPGRWVPKVDLSDMGERLENSMRRICGIVGADISMNNGRMRAMRDSAGNALNESLYGRGPSFMRLGRGLLEFGALDLGKGVDIKELAGEVLSEFFKESNAAFQTARVALYAEARDVMQAWGLDAAQRSQALDAAERAFRTPGQEDFTLEAMPLIKAWAPPVGSACLTGFLGTALAFFITRVPHLAILGGFGIGGVTYYFARKHQQHRAVRLLNMLPRNLYSMLAREMNSNIQRYADIINTARG